MNVSLDISACVGLLTLIILEIVLGIDNLVFIAILTNKLPLKQHDRARQIGLMLALIMRIGMILLISWMVTFNQSLFNLGTYSFSGRDLVLLVGGFFLIFKGTTELHDRLENRGFESQNDKNLVSFWVVVTQIVVLDAIFSMDAVITAVGMMNDIPIMILAVIVAMGVMLLASKTLTSFINAHPTVVVLCLSFLLVIGLSLVAEGFGVHIPKGYIYASIGFSIIIELLNQIARHNFLRNQERRPMRERTAEAILKLMGKRYYTQVDIVEEKLTTEESSPQEEFKDEERYMMNGVLTFSQRSIRSIMTPRENISWVNITSSLCEIRAQLLDTPHSLFPVCNGKIDCLIGVVRAKELLMAFEDGTDIGKFASNFPAILVPDTLDSINLLGVLRRAKGSLVIVINNLNIVQGLITPLDVLEAIAGEFPDADEIIEI